MQYMVFKVDEKIVAAFSPKSISLDFVKTVKKEIARNHSISIEQVEPGLEKVNSPMGELASYF